MQKTLDVINLVAPDVASSRSQSDLETAISLAEKRVSVGVWGDRYRQAVAYLAAHYLAVADKGNNPGPVTSEKAGSVSVSYGYSQQSSGLESTSYGQQFLELRDELPTTTPLTAYGDYDLYGDE
jgi:hypothetical protein